MKPKDVMARGITEEHKDLAALEKRMNQSNIGWAKLGHELEISGNAIYGWFKRTGRIPPGRKEELETALKKLEAEARAAGQTRRK